MEAYIVRVVIVAEDCAAVPGHQISHVGVQVQCHDLKPQS